jgi:glycosyltransferase involved in cell wall biosynthesis
MMPNKLPNQKYIYIVHDNIDWSNYKQIMLYNNNYIDTYIFINKYIKLNFESQLFHIDNWYVIENQINEMTNDVVESNHLFITYGDYNDDSNYEELIKAFSKLDSCYNLEIYGHIDDEIYYDVLSRNITTNNLTNINLYDDKLYDVTKLKNASYYCTFNKSKKYDYSLMVAIKLNKKIICSIENLDFENVKWYPNKYVHSIGDEPYKWFNIIKNDYLPYSYKHFQLAYSSILGRDIKKQKIDNYSISDNYMMIDKLKNNQYHKINDGYSILLIIKNKEKTIEKCILDIVDLVDEIIIIDYGSTDNTLYLIKKLDILYRNVFVYEYKINVPKNDTLQYYNSIKIRNNWSVSKMSYNKKIKWNANFYCIRNNFKSLLDHYMSYNCETGVYFNGLTVFINDDNYYVKNKSMFESNDIDNMYIENNSCDVVKISEEYDRFKYLKPIFINIKILNETKFQDHSILNINKTMELFNEVSKYYLYIPHLDKYIINDIHHEKYYNHIKMCGPSQGSRTIDDNDETNSIRPHLGPEMIQNKLPYFKKKKHILLVIDSYGWAFDNISKEIVRYNTNFDINVTTYPELRNKINMNYKIDNYRKKSEYGYCDVDLNLSFDKVIIFWYGDNTNIILDYFKSKGIKVYICIYDYTIWTNNPNKLIEQLCKDKLSYFLNKADGFLYGCDIICDQLNLNFQNIEKIHKYPCFDGVDSKLFKYYNYDDSIYTKNKLIVGWIGNSDPNVHGINKGFSIIKSVVEEMSDKFIFNPQDLMVKKISHDKIPEYLSTIDIIVCFSIGEGTPNQILEASSCGKCWVSTNVGIVTPLYNTYKNNPTGIIINRIKSELKQALSTLYNNRDMIVDFGKNGRRAIEKSWDWSIKSQQFYELFNQ